VWEGVNNYEPVTLFSELPLYSIKIDSGTRGFSDANVDCMRAEVE